MALGFDSRLKYEEYAINRLSKGQILVLGTDGLWETQNEKGEMFGKERLKAHIKQNAHLAAEEMITTIIKELELFRKSVRQDDDITLVVIKITA